MPEPELAGSLGFVTAQLPLAVGVETATIRLREEESERLHLLAGVGMPTGDVRRIALDLLTIQQVRSILALGAEHTLARRLGLVWFHGEWIAAGDETIGALLVGSRTERRPDSEQLALLRSIVDRLAERLTGVDRSRGALRSASLAFLRALVLAAPSLENGVLGDLRPRERTILELYADGLSAGEIAELLVISPHTVRTHLKLAYRRLGVHSRDEAINLVRREQLLMLL